MKRVSLKLPAGMVLGLAACTVYGNGQRIISQDSFAAARGEAFTATADNPSAIYYNPAGLTQISGSELRAGLYSIDLEPTFRQPPGPANTGQTYDINKHFAFVPQVFFADTLTNVPVSFGLGIYAPYGGSISWPDGANFRAVAIHGSTTYLRVNPAFAIQLTDQLSFGAGLSADYARVALEQGLHRSAVRRNDFGFTGDGWAAGYNAGVLWKPCEYFSLGATVRGATDFTLSGETQVIDEFSIANTRNPARADFEFPLTATFGASFRPTPKWNIEVDADYADWSSFGVITIRQQNPPPFPLHPNIPVKLNWQASWNYELGVTRYFDNGWHVSAGYVFSENSVPDANYTPLAADMDRHFFSLGVGHNGKKFDFDITYQLGYGPDHTVSGSQPSSTPGFFAGQTADGTYAFMSHAILVSAGMHF